MRDEVYFGAAPKGTLINSVGAGDSMIAGFSAKYFKTRNVVEAFRMAIASGSATAFNEDLATREAILTLIENVHVEKI